MELDLFSSLRARGWTGRGLVHVMGWFGSPNHSFPMTAYSSNSPLTIGKQLTIMQKCKVDGLILTWQGPTVSPFIHSVAMEFSQQCSERGMLFGLLMDPWICKQVPTGSSKEVMIIAALKDPTTQAILTAPSYLPEKYVLDFGTGANLSTLGLAFPTLSFLAQNIGFAWNPVQNPVNSTSAMNNFSTMKIPCITSRFKDGGAVSTDPAFSALIRGDAAGKDMNTSGWSPAGTNDCRVINNQAGQIALKIAASVPLAARYAAYVTWNCYMEDSSCEDSMSYLTNTLLS